MAAPDAASTVVLRPRRPSDREALAALANDRRISINPREALLRQSAIKDGVVQDQWVYTILRHEVARPEAR